MTTNIPRAIVLDFDFTVSHFIGSVASLCDIFTKRDVPLRLAHEAWQRSEEEGFTIQRCQQWVERLSNRALVSTEVNRDFEEWLMATLNLYEDTLPALMNWQQQGITIVIATFGDPDYQRQKIRLMNVPCQEVHVTTEANEKWKVVEGVQQRHGETVWFVDDKPQELDRARQSPSNRPGLTTFLIRRPDSPYVKVQPTCHHIEIQSLDDITSTEEFHGHP